MMYKVHAHKKRNTKTQKKEKKIYLILIKRVTASVNIYKIAKSLLFNLQDTNALVHLRPEALYKIFQEKDVLIKFVPELIVIRLVA